MYQTGELIKFSPFVFKNGNQPQTKYCIVLGLINDRVMIASLRELTGVGNASDFQKMDRETQGEALRELKEYGASIRQLERLPGIERGLIQRM